MLYHTVSHLNSSSTHLQVDFDESAVQNRFVVKPNVDPQLDESESFCLFVSLLSSDC